MNGHAHAAAILVLSDRAISVPPARAAVPCPLSTYQLAVLQWIANGKRDAQIAAIMGNTTEGAIQQHVFRILNVLGTSSRTSAAAIALRKGWVK